MELFLPQYGIMQEVHPGAWSGVFAQKNKLGQTMVYGAAIFTIIAITLPEIRRRAIFGLSLCAALVLLSTRSEEHTSELQSLMRISYAVFCLNNKRTHVEDVKRLDDNTDPLDE